jgi:hypothetical protein
MLLLRLWLAVLCAVVAAWAHLVAETVVVELVVCAVWINW